MSLDLRLKTSNKELSTTFDRHLCRYIILLQTDIDKSYDLSTCLKPLLYNKIRPFNLIVPTLQHQYQKES
jgi:hypothetical protein